MIGSIWGYVLLAGGNNTNNPTSNIPPGTPPEQPPTAISFKASNVDANVAELLPSLILTAPTNNTDPASLQQLLASVDGIEKIESAQFTPSQGTNGPAWIFIAQLKLKNDAEVVSTGIISLPNTVTFTNDLNLTQQHTFADPRTNAYLSIDSLPGDKLKMGLQASFLGKQIQNLIAFEQYNLTATAIPESIEGNFKIAKIENTLSFSATTTYSENATIEAQLKKIISENSAGSASEINVQRVFPELKFVFEKPYIPEDLNIFFSQQKGVLAFDFSEKDNNSAAIFFDESLNYNSLKTDIENGLNSLHFNLKETIEPEVPLSGSITLNEGSNVASIAENLSKSFGTEGLKEIRFTRTAIIEASELIDIAHDNFSYPLPAGKFNAEIKLGYTEGEEIPLVVSFSSLRGNAVEVSAIEKSLADELQ